MFEEKDVFLTARVLNWHVGGTGEDYEDQHRDYSFRKKDREMILEFCTTKNMGLGNTLFKKRGSNQVLCESEPSKMKLLLGLERSNKVCERHKSAI